MNPSDLRAPFFQRGYVRIKNGTGAVIPPFSVVLISSSAVDNNSTLHTVIKPNNADTDFNWDSYLVTWQFQIGSASNAEGMATNLVNGGYVRYDGSGTPAIKEIWGPKHNQLTLSKNYYGFRITGGNTTASGQNVTVARWTGSNIVVGKIDDASVSLGATCTVSVHVGTTYQTDSTMNITGVVNRGATLSGLSSPYCGVSQGNGIPVLMWVAC